MIFTQWKCIQRSMYMYSTCVCSSSLSTEVCRTRLRQNVTRAERRYHNFLQTLRVVWLEEGLRGLYGGMGAHLIRVVPNTAIVFFTYEAVVRVFQNRNDSDSSSYTWKRREECSFQSSTWALCHPPINVSFVNLGQPLPYMCIFSFWSGLIVGVLSLVPVYVVLSLCVSCKSRIPLLGLLPLLISGLLHTHPDTPKIINTHPSLPGRRASWISHFL